MRRLIVAGLVLAALAAGLAFAVTATQAQTGDKITITLDAQRKVTLVEVGGKGYTMQGGPPETVNTKIPPLSIVVFFNNPPGCVYIPNTGDWWC